MIGIKDSKAGTLTLPVLAGTLCASAVGMVGIGVAQLTGTATSTISPTDMVGLSEKVGQMTAQGILGLVAMVCVYGMVKLYTAGRADQKEANDRLFAVLEKNATASQSVTDVMSEVKETMKDCMRKQG